MPRVRSTRRADRDLEEIAIYIAGDDANAADALIDRFGDKFALLAHSRNSGTGGRSSGPISAAFLSAGI